MPASRRHRRRPARARSTRRASTSWSPRSGRGTPPAAPTARSSWPGSTCGSSPSASAPRCSSIDEADFRSRAAEFAAAFGAGRSALRGEGVPVHRDRPLGGRRGPGPGRLQRRRAGGGAAGRLPGRADRVARQQQVHRRAGRRGRGRGGPGRARLVPRDRPAGRDRPGARHGRARAGPADRRRRGAHPRVHRHRARGPEVRLLARRRARWRRRRGGAPGAQGFRAAAGRAAQPHRQPDLRHRRLRGGRAPGGPLPGRSCTPSTATMRWPAWTPWTSAAASASPTAPTKPRWTCRSWPRSCRRSSSGSATPPGWPCRGSPSNPGGPSPGRAR